MKLESVCTLIVDSEHKTAPRATQGYPSIRTPNIGKGRLKLEGVYRVSKETYTKWTRRAIPQADDLILAREAPVGNVAIIPDKLNPCLGQRTVLIRPDTKKIHPHFLCYYLLSNEIQNKMTGLSSGATVAHLNMKDIRELELTFIPKRKTQEQIASILSNYDSLIENNQRRINLLEQAAQNIYKEWFVNMRFPGCKEYNLRTNTQLPNNWKRILVKDYVEIISKGPSLNYKVEEGIPVLNQSCIRNGEISLDKIRIAAKLKDNKKHCYLRINDILINSMGQGTLGRVSKNNSIQEDYIIHNCIIFLRSKTIYSQTYLYQFISSKQSYFISVAQGSTGQTTLKKSLIENLEILVPEPQLLQKYDELVLPMWNEIGILKNQNSQLQKAQNILLPRLMNQTIRV